MYASSRRRNDTDMVTTYDIAKRAHVNQSTVSRVFSGDPRISKRTVQKVRRVCEEYGYVPNVLARGLRTQKVKAVAVYTPRPALETLTSAFVAIFLDAVRHEFVKHDYEVILAYDDPEDPSLDLGYLVKTRRADGILLLSPQEDDGRIEILRKEGVPHAIGGFMARRNPKMVCVDIDNYHKGYQSARYVIEKSCYDIGFIRDDAPSKANQDFCAGFYLAVKQAGISPRRIIEKIVPGRPRFGMTACAELLDQSVTSQVVVANSASLMLGVVETIKRRKSDVLAVGIDSPLLEELHPDVARIIHPVREFGREMALALLDLLEHGTRQRDQVLYTHIMDPEGEKYYVSPDEVPERQNRS